MTDRDSWWRGYQLQNVIEGTVVSILIKMLTKKLPDAPPEVWKEHLTDSLAEFSDEFRHHDHGADRDAMTRQQEREHNKKVFADAITSVAPRWGLDAAEFTENYARRDKLWNQVTSYRDHPAPAGR